MRGCLRFQSRLLLTRKLYDVRQYILNEAHPTGLVMNPSIEWIVHQCILPTLQQGALISAPLLVTGVTIRLCVFLKLPDYIIHALVAMMGMYMLWFFYSNGLVYFVLLCGTVYVILLTVERHKGVVIALISVTFLLVR